ncbi:Beta-glucan synthesis-associated protein, partial [Globisporangium polare]
MLAWGVGNRIASVLALDRHFDAKSGIRTWVDPATPEDRQVYTSSRGD